MCGTAQAGEVGENTAGLSRRLHEVAFAWAARRGHRGYTAFAKACGVEPSTYYRYIQDILEAEKGVPPEERTEPAEPSASILAKIAVVAGVSVDALLYGEREERPAAANDPDEQVTLLAETLLAAPQLRELPPRLQFRYRERIEFIETQLRRLVYDARQYLGQLRAECRREKFDPDKFRENYRGAGNEEVR